MWKRENEPQRPATPAAPSMPTTAASASTPIQPRVENRPMAQTDMAHIGKSVLIKGQLSGSEDLYLDGEVEGSIDLHSHSLVVGPNGRVRANVFAKDIVIHGKVDGNVNGTERVELKKSAVLMGDIATQRIVIEDGAYFKGAIDIKKDGSKPAEKPAAMAAAATPQQF